MVNVEFITKLLNSLTLYHHQNHAVKITNIKNKFLTFVKPLLKQTNGLTVNELNIRQKFAPPFSSHF